MVHVYIIHLKHRADRKKQFITAWNNAQMSHTNVHWHTATLGAALSDTRLANFSTVARTRRARSGRVGCYCSHVSAIKKAIRLNHFPLLILEDDAIPVGSPNLAELFETAPPDAKLLYFAANPMKNRKRMKGFCNKNGWIQPNSQTEQLYGAYAYGIPNASSAQDLVDFLDTHKMTYDSALIRWSKQPHALIAIHCPFLFAHSDGFSNIEGIVRHIHG